MGICMLLKVHIFPEDLRFLLVFEVDCRVHFFRTSSVGLKHKIILINQLTDIGTVSGRPTAAVSSLLHAHPVGGAEN